MTVLKEVQETFGSDPRFVLISLACGKDAAEAEKFIKENGLNWTHGFAGDSSPASPPVTRSGRSRTLTSSGPIRRRRRIPVTFLIGPDGRIVAHDLMGDRPGGRAQGTRESQALPRGGQDNTTALFPVTRSFGRGAENERVLDIGRSSRRACSDASIELVLIVKWTAVLALAWLTHGMLAGRNPRGAWRFGDRPSSGSSWSRSCRWSRRS